MTYPRRILLAVTGLSPQIVTETLYALAVGQDTPWIPDEIHLITSCEGAERARLSLLDPAAGQFHALCRDYPSLATASFPADNINPLLPKRPMRAGFPPTGAPKRCRVALR